MNFAFKMQKRTEVLEVRQALLDSNLRGENTPFRYKIIILLAQNHPFLV